MAATASRSCRELSASIGLVEHAPWDTRVHTTALATECC